MRAPYHIAASAGISLGYQAAVHSWPATLSCFLSGILIDTDHYLEYWATIKKFPFHYQDLINFFYDTKQTKNYLIFHAYEYLIILWGSIAYFHLGNVWIGLAIGLTAHILFDQFTNPGKPLFYFLTYRILNQFEKSKILTDKYFKNLDHFKQK